MGDWWNQYMPIPFAEKGRSKEGSDCWGLPYIIYPEQLGIILPDYLDCYENTNDREGLAVLIAQERESRWKETDTPEPFNLIFLRMRGLPMHVGLVTKPGHFIHCAKGIGTSHERFDNMRWKDKVLGFSRYE